MTIRVDEEPARDNAEAESLPQRTGTVDQHGKRDGPFLEDPADQVSTLRILGDGEELESSRLLFPRALPPGQLLPARSPGREAEDDRVLTE